MAVCFPNFAWKLSNKKGSFSSFMWWWRVVWIFIHFFIHSWREREKFDEREYFVLIWPQVGWGYPPNLSISLSGGNETKEDSLSNGERKGKSSALNPLVLISWECGVWEVHFLSEYGMSKSIGIWLRSQRGWQACMTARILKVEHSFESSCLRVQL